MATGVRDGKTVQVELSPPSGPRPSADTSASAAPDPLALAFDQYQRTTGILQDVPGLAIQSVRVDVLEGGTVRASQDTSLAAAAASTGDRQ
jgi:hypothetical protein